MAAKKGWVSAQQRLPSPWAEPYTGAGTDQAVLAFLGSGPNIPLQGRQGSRGQLPCWEIQLQTLECKEMHFVQNTLLSDIVR